METITTGQIALRINRGIIRRRGTYKKFGRDIKHAIESEPKMIELYNKHFRELYTVIPKDYTSLDYIGLLFDETINTILFRIQSFIIHHTGNRFCYPLPGYGILPKRVNQ